MAQERNKIQEYSRKGSKAWLPYTHPVVAILMSQPEGFH